MYSLHIAKCLDVSQAQVVYKECSIIPLSPLPLQHVHFLGISAAYTMDKYFHTSTQSHYANKARAIAIS